MLYMMRYDSPIGPLLLVEKERALAGVWMEGQKYYLGSLQKEASGQGKAYADTTDKGMA